MDSYKYYLILRFRGASIFIPSKERGVRRAQVYSLFGERITIENPEDIDYDMPIGTSQVSNMLHAMFGLVPVPTYRKSFLKRNEDIYKMAERAMVKYDGKCNEDMYRKSEYVQTFKPQFDSHMKIKTKLRGEYADGFYRWEYLRRCFGNDAESFRFLINFLSKILGVDDVTKSYTFECFAEEFTKHLNKEEVINFYEGEKFKDIENRYLKTPWAKAIFSKSHRGNTGSNTSYEKKTPLLNKNGNSSRRSVLSGVLVIPFNDDWVYKTLSENGKLPSFLDGGIIDVIGCEKCLPTPNYLDDFMEISEQKNVLNGYKIGD